LLSRDTVAREAARLIYRGIAEEYKQAKEMAARSLGLNAMPSNHEVAEELDLLADREEGTERQEQIVRLRGEALDLMKALDEYGPILTGSVWRGTARRGSDVDINVYSDEPEKVEEILREEAYKVSSMEEAVVNRAGRTIRTWHISVVLGEGVQAEVVVRPEMEGGEVERCEIYGDLKRGLNTTELEKLMRSDPLRKFVPKRRQR
jgi:predicted nucleotidyltransferase